MKSTISSKGQVTVPSVVRERLGLVAGTCVEFELRDEGVLVRKSVKGVHPVDRVFGSVRSGKRVDALIDQMRGPRAPKK
jgi:AbrB family looped-hinge helix DNA binding protein